MVKLLVRVLDEPNGIRIAAEVGVVDAGDPMQTFSGTSRNDTADSKNILTLKMLPNHTYHITASDASATAKKQVTATQETEQTITLTLAE